MQQVMQAVMVVCYLGFGWAAGSTRLFQDREHGCATSLAFVALVIAVVGVAWSAATGSHWWPAFAVAIGALVLGGLAGGLRKRY